MLFIGGDASKGYADFCCVDEAGKVLWRAKLDDTYEGHLLLIGRLREHYTGGVVYVGLESSGGVERNWLRDLRDLAKGELPGLKVLQVNPLSVKSFRKIRLHEAVTDPSSALAIANYLRFSRLDSQVSDPGVEEAKRLENYIAGQVKHCGGLKTQLQGLLVNSHPELVRYCRQGLPGWVLDLLSRYSTNTELASASIDDLVQIPFITEKRARSLVQTANQSVASAAGVATSKLVLSLVAEISRLENDVQALRESLHSLFVGDQAVAIWNSLTGIGIVTAVYLRLLLGDCSRIHSEAAAVALVGLDPRIHNSGDEQQKLKISRFGDSRARALLFNCAMAAIRDKGRFQAFYGRLLAKGKPKMVAIVAVMAKLIKVGYACQLKKSPYEPNYPLPEIGMSPKPRATMPDLVSLQAPISRREALRRKNAAGATKRGQASKSMITQPLPID